MADVSKPSTLITKASAITGCSFSKDDLMALYRLLDEKTREAAQLEIRDWIRLPEHTDEQFIQVKDYTRTLFQVSVSIEGFNGESIVAAGDRLFQIPHLPDRVRKVYFDSSTLYRIRRNLNPRNYVTVLLDFDKPSLFDFNISPSTQTPNNSNIVVTGDNDTWVNGVFQKFIEFTTSKNNRRGPIHRAHLYDKLLLLVAIPASFWIISKLSLLIERLLPGVDSFVRYAGYVYVFFLTLFTFRFIFNYAKWAWPTVEFISPFNTAATHRTVWTVIVLGVIASAIYDLIG